MVGHGWGEAKLHEHPNAYTESVCKYMAMLWCSLCNGKRIPHGAVVMTWVHAVEGVFACFLEGFSRVPRCSTEGRSLMSMDVACFASEIRGRGIQDRLKGHASAPEPPTVSTERGMAYVDTYIKIFYFPPMVRRPSAFVSYDRPHLLLTPCCSKDALEWINENFSRYKRNHMVALIVGSATASSENSVDSISKLMHAVQSLYATSTPASPAAKAKIASV